jgi:Methyltransferase domain
MEREEFERGIVEQSSVSDCESATRNVQWFRQAAGLIPEVCRRLIRLHLSRRWDAKFENQPVANVFAAVYRDAKWGTGPDGDFYSGSGSHDPAVVLPYVEGVRAFLQSLPKPPSLVDLGCGDFNIGRQLRPHCDEYIACDVVPDLIARNQVKFGEIDVEFRCLDITENDYPDGEVVVLRQVLQHLSNLQILKVLPKLYRYKFLLLTEHVPADPDFQPNLEKPAGATVRLSLRSGVVLTEPPFNFRARSENSICSTDQPIGHLKGVVRTVAYEL